MLADEKLTAFLELETAIRPTSDELHFLTKQDLATQFASQGNQAERSETEQGSVEPASGTPQTGEVRRVSGEKPGCSGTASSQVTNPRLIGREVLRSQSPSRKKQVGLGAEM